MNKDKRFFLISLILFIVPSIVLASTQVKVGYFFDGDYMYKDSDGDYYGYNVEYLYEVARFAGWKYTFVDYESFEDECAALERGEIDLIPAMFYSKERAEKYLFSNEDMGKLYVTIAVREDDKLHSYGDYNSLNGLKIGILNGTIDGEKVVSMCKRRNIHPQIIKKASNTELLSALDNKELDAIGETFLGSSSKYRVIAEFDPMAMYFTITKTESKLLSELNDAMEKISINNPNFQNSLYHKYFSVSNGQNPTFSKKEQQYINGSRVLRVALQINNAPYGYINKNGVPTGAVVDMFDKISNMSGLHFVFVPVNNAVDAMKIVEEGKADIVGRCLDDSIAASKYKLLLTNQYITVTLTQISKKETTVINSLGVTEFVKPFYLRKSVYAKEQNIHNKELYFMDSNSCFAALKNNEVDAVIIGSVRANYFMNFNRASAYKVNQLSGSEFGVSAAVNRDSPEELFSIINKCIFYMGSSLMNDYILRHSNVDTDSFQVFFSRLSAEGMAIFIMVLFLLVVLLLVAIISLAVRTKQKNELRVAQKENQIKTEFMGTMSHDMRTPLNAVLGYAHLAKSSKDVKKKNAYLDNISQAGNLLLHLVDSALLISKVENKKFELHPTPTECAEMINEIVISINQMAAKKRIKFTFSNGEAKFDWIRVDKLNVQKILMNLLGNAINYTNENGTVSFVFERLISPYHNKNAHILVSDTGIGMSKAFMEKMYNPFTKEQQAKITDNGSGLGLSIVKHLVDLMGGEIEVKSELGRGTEFNVYLPIEECKPIEKNNTDQEGQLHLTKNNAPQKKVLLCEDNPMNREIAIALLGEENYSVVCAENGEQGVNLFSISAPGTFDAILMDIRMPIMNGYDAAKTIRALNHPDARKIPIIAMSADAYSEDVKKCLEVGMNSHVAKPIDAQRLFQILRKEIEGTKN